MTQKTKGIFISLENNQFWLYLCCFLCFMGSSVTIRFSIPFGRDIFGLIFGVMSIVYFIKSFNDRKFNTYVLLIGGFYLILSIATMLGNKATYCYYYVFANFAAVLLVNYEIETDAKRITKILIDVSTAMLILNFLLLLIKPNGFSGTGNTAYYFFGFRIAFTPYAFVAIFISLIYDRIHNLKFFSKRTIFISILSISTLALKSVQTGVASLVVFCALCTMILMFDFNMPNIWLIYILYVILAVAIIGFGIQYRVGILSFVLEDVLHKDLTFDNRTYIWNSTILAIMESPWIGHGAEYSALVALPFSYRLLPAHNQFLCVLSDSGIIGFVSFLLILIRIGDSISSMPDAKNRSIFIASMLAWLIIFFTEIQTTKALVFIAFTYLSNAKYLFDDSDQVKE